MKIGIKTGLRNDPRADLAAANPDFCEIWFHSGKIEAYKELFEIIKKQGCASGIHFWGALADGTLANIAYPNREMLKASITLVEKTIDVAASEKAWYVNVHPGAAVQAKVDFDKETFSPFGPVVSFEQSQRVLHQSLTHLGHYAQERGVQLFLESVPNFTFGPPWHGASGRLKPVNLYELPIRYFDELLTIPNVYFTNDFGHSACNAPNAKRSDILALLHHVSNKFLTQTKLLHVSFIIEPFNGTDYHGHLFDPEFLTTAAVPNRDEMRSLLRLYKDRSDVGALVEPAGSHPQNFAILKQLISSL